MNPYSSTLLNDLHHHFPELLYRQERFQTIQDVLQYVVDVASVNHFQQEQGRYISGLSVPSQEPEEKEEKVYNFTESSSAYSTPVSSSSVFAPVSFSASPSASSSPVVPASPSVPAVPAVPISDSSEAEALLQALFRRRSYAPVSQSSTSRFRMSVPFNLSSFLSSEYSAPVPSALHGLSQLNDLLRPVIIRPTDQHLSENTYVYRSEISLNDNCSICQDPMEAGQETRTILACSHCFHRDCIDRWFQEHVQCPTCRHDVREST